MFSDIKLCSHKAAKAWAFKWVAGQKCVILTIALRAAPWILQEGEEGKKSSALRGGECVSKLFEHTVAMKDWIMLLLGL